MLTVNTNTTSLITQLNLSRANNCVKTSIERLSTGCKINRASDDAANMSISKNMSCQISGTDVALDNAQQAVNLLQTADGVLDSIQADLLRIRDLAVEASNGTYSAEEKQMLQQEVNQRIEEIYKQRNNAMFNQIRIFGEAETPPSIVDSSGSGAATVTATATAVAGTKPVTPLTEAEAIAQGYTCIKSEADFENIKSDTSGKYCLMCDIDFSKISGWGRVTLQAGAELNGNGYSINNLTIVNQSGEPSVNPIQQGIFYQNNGTIKNLNMNNVNIDTCYYTVGGIVGYNQGTIDNCSVSGSINAANNTGGLVGRNSKTITNCSSFVTVTGTECTGGLVGYSDDSGATIDNCSVSGSVTGTGYWTGGLVGYSKGTIANSSSSSIVTGTSDWTGGLVGYSKDGTITDCSSSGDVTGTSYTGGLIGSGSGTITNCSSSATVTGNNYTGGLAGSGYGTITNCSSSGDVTGTSYTGGLAGSCGGTITNCSSSGSVTGNNYTGGLAGSGGGTITNCSSTGTVTGTGERTGGLVGSGYGTITNSSSSGTVTGTDYTGGLVGNSSGTITDCSSSGYVTGTDYTGGLVGGEDGGTIDQSYSKGDVSGNDYVGGLTGYNESGNISNSYALGDVSGNDYVGGFAGQHHGWDDSDNSISTSYSTGTVTGTGSNVGGFIGVNGYIYIEEEYEEVFEGNINNSYTTSELDFYGNNIKGTIENNHGTTTQTGVTAHKDYWFEEGSNLTFLGDAYDTRYNPPDLKENSRGERLPVNITFQIGANSGEENTLTIDTGFSLENYYADVTTLEGAQKAIVETDALSGKVSSFRFVIVIKEGVNPLF